MSRLNHCHRCLETPAFPLLVVERKVWEMASGIDITGLIYFSDRIGTTQYRVEWEKADFKSAKIALPTKPLTVIWVCRQCERAIRNTYLPPTSTSYHPTDTLFPIKQV